MRSVITIYEKSTCSKCRLTKQILDDAGVEYDDILYYETPLSSEKIKELLQKLGMAPRDLMRKKEQIYRDLNLKDESLTDEQLIQALADNPDLIERPIIEKGEKAVLGRPPENVKELL